MHSAFSEVGHREREQSRLVLQPTHSSTGIPTELGIRRTGQSQIDMKLSIVLSTQPASFSALAYKGELEQNIAKIAGLGYDGVELAVRDPQSLDLEAVSGILKRHDLSVPAIGTGQAYGEEGLSFTAIDGAVRHRAIERIKAQIELGARLQALVILGLIRGRVEADVSRPQAYEWLVQALTECAEYAAVNGVKLAMEPINRYETDLIATVAEGLELIQHVGSEAFGLLLDSFHMNIEEPAIEHSIRSAGDRIFHFHIADSNRWYPGAGHIDFKGIVEGLAEVGYDGFLSAEILPLPDADTCAEKTIEKMRAILK